MREYQKTEVIIGVLVKYSLGLIGRIVRSSHCCGYRGLGQAVLRADFCIEFAVLGGSDSKPLFASRQSTLERFGSEPGDLPPHQC